MIDNTFLRIIQQTGQFPTECKCDICKGQCRTPCLGTPSDILRLIKAGYKDQLALTYWMVGVASGHLQEPILMVQLKETTNGCIFHENGLCFIHYSGLKPTEGRLSSHRITVSNLVFEKSLSYNVAKEWYKFSNLSTIIEIFCEMGYVSPRLMKKVRTTL